MVNLCVVCNYGRSNGIPSFEHYDACRDVYVQKEKGLIWH